jgi:hypothetical protein
LRYRPRPPVSDLDIERATHLCVQQYGSLAVAKARQMVEIMREKGDHDGADMWLRIVVAIGALGDPPSAAPRQPDYS